MTLDEAAFKDAVLAFNLEGARACLEAGVDPDVVLDQKRARRSSTSDQWPKGFRALHIAAFEDDQALAELVLAAGADVEALTAFRASALALAAEWDSPAVLEVLLAAGADVGRALVAAAARGHRAVALRLVDKSAPDVRDDAAKVSCTREGDPHVLRALLLSGARAAEDARWTALQARRFELIEILKDSPRYSLVDAAIDGDARAVRDALPADDVGRALCAASRMGHLEVCRVLVDAGAPLEERSSMGTPMKLALEGGGLDVAHLLAQAGAKLEDKYGPYFRQLVGRRLSEETYRFMNTRQRCAPRVLARAAEVGDLAALRVLLEAGFDPNVADAFGRLALGLAVDGGSVEAVVALLAAGADPRKKDARGVSVLRYALTADDVLEDWLDKDAPIDPEHAQKVLARPAVQLLLSAGASLEDDV